jgi:hypothetical protein
MSLLAVPVSEPVPHSDGDVSNCVHLQSSLTQLGRSKVRVMVPYDAATLHKRCDPTGSDTWIVVRPQPDDGPAVGPQSLISVSVAPPVRVDLGTPPFRVRLRPRSVARATVPEAAVHKDGDPRHSEDNVSTPSDFGQRAHINAKAEAETVQGGT